MSAEIEGLDDVDLKLQYGCLTIKVVVLHQVYIHKYGYAPNHKHEEDFEFHIIPKGKGYIRIEGVDLEVRTGELFITGPNVTHMQIADERDPMLEYCLRCQIEVMDRPFSTGFSFLQSNLIKSTFSKSYPRIFKDIFRIDKKFEEILSEAQQKNFGYFLRIQSLILDMIIYLFRTVTEAENIVDITKIPVKNPDTLLLEKLMEYVETMYIREITVQEIAKLYFTNIKRINKIMKNNFNQTFHDYLLSYRVNIAKKFLSSTNLSIQEIAFESGFSSCHYMYKIFKRFGLPTPGEIRRKTEIVQK